jgi:hypothetical protein
LYLGQAFLWLAVDHNAPIVRQETIKCLSKLSTVFPAVTSNAVKLALVQLLFENKRVSQSEPSQHRSSRLSMALTSSTRLENQPNDLKERLLVDLVLISHHQDFGKFL